MRESLPTDLVMGMAGASDEQIAQIRRVLNLPDSHAPQASTSAVTTPLEPEPGSDVGCGLAAKVFQLLAALDPEERLRRAPPIKVFLLRYRENYSLADTARACGCAKSLVKLRLKTLREALPWRPQQLRELSAQVEAMQEALTDSRARRIYRKGAVHGDEEDDNGGE
jgi:hypothetical protein